MSNWGTTPGLPDLLDLGERPATYSEAIYEAMKIAMAEDDSVEVFGEGVTDKLGSYGTTAGLINQFGPERVFDVPIAEQIITGLGVGMAMAGKRPIVIHPRNDFMFLALDQLCNHAAKWRYMYGGKTRMPLVVRSVACRGWGSAAQHSQAIHSTLAHFPGLVVLVPFTPSDAKGFLLWAALKSEEPVMIMEHKYLWKLKGNVPEGKYFTEPGEPLVLRDGTDVTIVGVSYGVALALEAAEKLSGFGISAEVVDIRALKPLRVESIRESLKKTGRLMVVDPAHRHYGASGEIVAEVLEGFPMNKLKASPVRVAYPDTPIPASSEYTYYFTAENLISIAKKIVKK